MKKTFADGLTLLYQHWLTNPSTSLFFKGNVAPDFMARFFPTLDPDIRAKKISTFFRITKLFEFFDDFLL
jgi:hypothetical protein